MGQQPTSRSALWSRVKCSAGISTPLSPKAPWERHGQLGSGRGDHIDPGFSAAGF